MRFALTTRWNASRHTRGESMIEEILGLGFDHVELGYDLRIDLVPGVKTMVADGSVSVDSVHNYCPVPVAAPMGHPELYTLSDPDRRVREQAVEYTLRTIRFAAEIGAGIVIVHAGNIRMKHMTEDLRVLHEQGKQFTPAYEKTKLKLQVIREKKVQRQLDHLYSTVERLLPTLTETKVRLAFENLPSWEAIPSEIELETLLKDFASDRLAYWHDIGHGQARENLGLINQERWLERLQPHLAGLHVHDVAAPAYDHVMPPAGDIDFTRFKRFAKMHIPRVLEPTPAASAEELTRALGFLHETWG